jgi:hypothetical protein
MLLRHEAGHAINYAYRLWKETHWREVFGSFSKPYRDTFHPEPASRDFVRHMHVSQYGVTYAQKHPDEDFAETFAVWLTPRSAWRRRYRTWPALEKLKYVDCLMQAIRRQPPRRIRGKLVHPLKEIDMLLAEHYGQRAERFRAAAQGYVDHKLRAVFPKVRAKTTLSASDFFREHHQELLDRMIRWSPLDGDDAKNILLKLEDRAAALDLTLARSRESRVLLDVMAMATGLAVEFAYCGRLMG